MENHPDKGKKGGRCNVTACQKPGAMWFNKSTEAYYCEDCAREINWPGGRADTMRLYGVPLLCELEQEEFSGSEKPKCNCSWNPDSHSHDCPVYWWERSQLLRQQLAAAKEENGQVRQANLDVMMHFEDMKAAKEEAEARVAELAAKAHNLSFGIVNSLTDEQQEPFAKQFAELQDCIVAQSSEPYVLRKQAEAVEHYAEALGMWLKDLPGRPCASFVEGIRSAAEQADRQAQRLRQQADEAERAGGEQ